MPRLRLIAPRKNRKCERPADAEVFANCAMLIGPERFLTEALPVIIRPSSPSVEPVRRQVSLTAAPSPSSGPSRNTIAARFRASR